MGDQDGRDLSFGLLETFPLWVNRLVSPAPVHVMFSATPSKLWSLDLVLPSFQSYKSSRFLLLIINPVVYGILF